MAINYNDLFTLGGSTPINAPSAQLKPVQQPAKQPAPAVTQTSGGVKPVTSSTISTPVNMGGGNSYNLSNPVLQPTPSQPAFDESPFNNLIDQINGLGKTYQDQYQTYINSTNAQSDQAVKDLEAQKTEGETNLDLYNQQAQTDTNNNVNEQRRAQAEIQQGLQARYGGTTGTGAFASELSGNTALNNIASYRQGYQQDVAKSEALRSQLITTYLSQRNKLENDRQSLLQQAKDSLSQQLAQLKVQAGNVGIAKSQQQKALISQYQSLVNDINARNTARLQTLEDQATQIHNALQAKQYELTYAAANHLPTMYEKALANNTLSGQGLKQAADVLGVPPGTFTNPNDVTSQFINGGQQSNAGSGSQADQGSNILSSTGTALYNDFKNLFGLQ